MLAHVGPVQCEDLFNVISACTVVYMCKNPFWIIEYPDNQGLDD